jgi:putative ABC transport system substrate-binding protein
VNRREVIILVGGAAAAWPMAARAQKAIPVIGYLSARSVDDSAHLVAAVQRGLNETGYFEGQNVAIEYRWAQGIYDRLPGLAADLIGRQVAVIVAVGGEQSVFAAKAATSTIPIVFTSGSDPVKTGFVDSLNRPGGNLTGVSLIISELEAKRMGLLRELIPKFGVIAVLINPIGPNFESQLKEIQAAARAVGQEIHIVHASSERGLEDAFATVFQQRIGALFVASDPFFTSRRNQIVAAASRLAIPTMYSLRDFPAAGGLIAYGSSLEDGYRQAGIYAGKILKGAKPADLPVQQSTKFELVINLKTAKALGLTLPSGMLSIADEVIE